MSEFEALNEIAAASDGPRKERPWLGANHREKALRNFSKLIWSSTLSQPMGSPITLYGGPAIKAAMAHQTRYVIVTELDIKSFQRCPANDPGPPRARPTRTDGLSVYDWAAAISDAAAGVVPAPPDLSPERYRRRGFRRMLAAIVEHSRTCDLHALQANPIRVINSTTRALERYRRLCIDALTRSRAQAMRAGMPVSLTARG